MTCRMFWDYRVPHSAPVLTGEVEANNYILLKKPN